MKSKTMILMVVAVVCGLAASYMTSRLLADRNEKVSILVAKQRLSAWTPVKNAEDMFELEEHTKNDVPKNAVTKFDSVRDQTVVRAMDKGEPLVAENLMDKTKAGLEALLPPGKRAVAVRTTAECVAGGFVMPGSRVDVIHATRRGDKDSDSKVVLQNILVRAVDQQAMKPDDKPGLVPATVTMEVTPAEALVLARVKDTGTLTLALRAAGDDHIDVVETTHVAAPPLPPPPKPVELPKVVELPKPPASPKQEVVAKAATEPPAEKKVLVIQNGSQWLRATYVIQDGETHTTIERSQPDSLVAPPSAPSRTR
jgi:pilus assembly protein CpaB